MNKDEITQYLMLSSAGQVCVLRKVLKEQPKIAMLIHIRRCKEEDYSSAIYVTFDPVEMIGQGEGWNWTGYATNLDKTILLLESYLGLSISQWQNFTKTGGLLQEDSRDDVSLDFTTDLDYGVPLLPKGFKYKAHFLSFFTLEDDPKIIAKMNTMNKLRKQLEERANLHSLS